MARPTAGFSNSQLGALRTVSGVIAADNASLVDANYAAASAIDCRGFDTIFVGVEITAGSSPTATIEALFRDGDAPDGSRWKRIIVGAAPGVTATALANPTTGALDGTSLAELRVYGNRAVFLRITAVTNSGSTTAITILGMPGQMRGIERNPYS